MRETTRVKALGLLASVDSIFSIGNFAIVFLVCCGNSLAHGERKCKGVVECMLL